MKNTKVVVGLLMVRKVLPSIHDIKFFRIIIVGINLKTVS